MDATKIDTEEISHFAGRVLDHGVADVTAWGPDCERVHDIFDERQVGREVLDGREPDDVMTVWLSNETLGHAIWHATCLAYPFERHVATYESVVAVIVDNDA